jgi:L-fuculose-phosphate aldolase
MPERDTEPGPHYGKRNSARPRRPAQERGTGVRGATRERILRAEVVETCKRLQVADLIGAGEGNVSVRLAQDRFLITPRGLNKGYLAASDLVVVSGSGQALKGHGVPSSELGMHLAAYAARPDVQAVVHAHPLTAVALTVAGLPPPNDLVPEAAIVLGEVAVAPFAIPTTPELAASLAPLWPRHDVVLLERHGAVTLGRTLADALDRMEILERVARMSFIARVMGSCQPLPRDAVERVLAEVRWPSRGG